MSKFQKGQSGNPRGRPSRSVEDAKKSVLDRLFDATAEEAVIRAMISKASEGDVGAFRALYERKYGKVTAPQEQETVTEVVVTYE
jgi:hypothetical protein